MTPDTLVFNRPLRFLAWDPVTRTLEPISLYWFQEHGVTAWPDPSSTVGDWTLVQYVGADDADGVPIHEGHIVEWEGLRAVVRWTGPGAYVHPLQPPNPFGRSFYYGEEAGFTWNELRIVGHALKDPELLEMAPPAPTPDAPPAPDATAV